MYTCDTYTDINRYTNSHICKWWYFRLFKPSFEFERAVGEEIWIQIFMPRRRWVFPSIHPPTFTMYAKQARKSTVQAQMKARNVKKPTVKLHGADVSHTQTTNCSYLPCVCMVNLNPQASSYMLFSSQYKKVALKPSSFKHLIISQTSSATHHLYQQTLLGYNILSWTTNWLHQPDINHINNI